MCALEASSAESAVLSSASKPPASGKSSGSAKSNRGRARSSPSTGPTPTVTTTCGPSSQPREVPTSFAADSRARTSPKQASKRASKASAQACGGSLPGSFAWFDPDTSSWKMFHRSLNSGWAPYLGTWPRSGMMQNGTAYRRQPLVPLTSVIGSGSWPTPTVADTYTDRLESSQQKDGSRHSLSLGRAVMRWPTPLKSDGEGGKGRRGKGGPNLRTVVQMFPTPTVFDSRSGMKGVPEDQLITTASGIKRLARPDGNTSNIGLAGQVRGSLNPTWVEWLMGYPSGWTELPGWETPSSRKSRNGSGSVSS
jgi:hypothetical protein